MTSDAAGGHVRGWRFVARIAAAVFLVAVTWMGFTTIGEDANLDCGTALAPDYSALPDDGRFVFLASTSRLRYGPNARDTWKPDLHLALWNPYQALDIDAPALITYGFAAPALDAVEAWLGGTLEAQGSVPVPGFA